MAGEQVETVVDTGASASVVGKRLVYKLGIWKRVKKVKFREGDRSLLGGNCLVITTLKVIESSLVLDKFALDAEVLDIRNRDVILGLFW